MKIRQGADGLHLFDRHSGVNILFDEIQPPGDTASKAPRFVSFALTNQCDLHCPFCYAPKAPAQLKLGDVVSWSHELDSNGCLGIGFGGGEPTLFPCFSKLCKTIVDTTQLSVSFTTHAHRLTATLCNELSGYVHFIRVSMDGVHETYESIRGRPFTSLVNQIQRIRDLCAFGINYVVNDATINDLDEAVDLANSLGAREMLILPEVSREGLSSSTQSQLSDWINAYRGHMRLSISEMGATDNIPLADPFSRERGILAYVHVNAKGQVSRTSYERENIEQIDKDRGILSAIAHCQGGIE